MTSMRNKTVGQELAPDKQPTSAWSPLGYPAFAMLWFATILSNIGTWMHDVGAGWLMTELAPSPIMVAMVQSATTLPVFLLALIAGSIADIVDRRKLLIVLNVFMATVAAVLSSFVVLGWMTPTALLIFTFLLGTGAAFMAPAWQAIVPSLVPRPHLSAAIALNSTGINVSRAIGPALAGFLIVAVGLWSPFALNAISFLGIIAALLWWRAPASVQGSLPPERVGPAVIAGLRFAWHSPALRSTLVRSFAFFLFASALWAMLPLIAKDQLSGGAALYGLLLTSVGAGAVAGALVLPKLKKSFSPSILVAIGTVGIALVLAIFATVSDARLAVAAAAIAGASWIMVLSSLNVSAQTALPNWVRARGLSIFLTVFFGAMSAGSLVWGQIASLTSIPTSLLIAASGAVALIPLTWRARLNQGEDLNHSPSMHWPAPILAEVDPKDRGPVMIQLTYTVDRDNADEFQRLMDKLAAARRRNGAYGWSLMQAAEDPMTFVETWYEASWLNHLRHHERVTESERTLQTRVWALLKDEAKPQVAHYLAPSDQTEKN